MSHNLAITRNGRHAMYSLRKKAWHSLGTVVEQPLDTDGIRAAAGLDWEPTTSDIVLADGRPVQSHKAILRSDNMAQLGIVGAGYVPVGNGDMFNLLATSAGASEMIVETAGALGNGETVWLMVRIPSMTFGKGDDHNETYALVKNSHDGSGKFVWMPTTVRVVCANTLRMAIGNESRMRGVKAGSVTNGYALRHTSRIKDNLASIAQAFARTRSDFEQTRTNFEALSARKLTTADWEAMIGSAFPQPKEDDKGSVLDAIVAEAEGKSEHTRAQAIAQARMDRLERILAGATCNVAGTVGTLWAGLQAITEYVDHESRTRVTGEGQSAASQRFESSMFGGSGDQAKARAYATAVQLATV